MAYSSSSSNPKPHINLFGVDSEWWTSETEWRRVLALKRATTDEETMHIDMLFETNNECVVCEYGRGGIRVSRRPQLSLDNPLGLSDVMGDSNKVYVFKMTKCFHEHSRYLRDVYSAVEGLTPLYKPGCYSRFRRNCRHFIRDLCKKLNLNQTGD